MALRVCYFGTYRADYVRTRILIAGLRANGVEVVECHATLWRGVEDRVAQAGGGWKHPRFWLRVVRTYAQLLWRYLRSAEYDVMLIGYPGQFDAFIGRILTFFSRKPFALDILMSLHLIAEERGLTKKSPFTGRLIFFLEKNGLKQPDLLIADTPEYRDYYVNKYGLDEERFALVPMGAEEQYFYPRPEIEPPDDGYLHLLYYGTFIPLHGVETMIRAVGLLGKQAIGAFKGIIFHLYGAGQEEAQMQQLATELGLTNVHFHGWVEKEQLPTVIAQSHLCFGVFGTTKQSRCTIQNKIWECMAMQRPVITGDSETIRAELTHREHLYLVERANPAALADGIHKLATTPALRERLSRCGWERVQQNTTTTIGAQLRRVLEVL